MSSLMCLRRLISAVLRLTLESSWRSSESPAGRVQCGAAPRHRCLTWPEAPSRSHHKSAYLAGGIRAAYADVLQANISIAAKLDSMGIGTSVPGNRAY